MRRGTSTGLTAILAVCAALVIPTVALAAPPPNDDFADAELITGFPATATGTNLEATTEEGEPVPTAAVGAQGHTVWYEWEATSDGFVTVSSCDSDFFTTLGVYTGGPVTSLTEVAGNFASLGPDCPNSLKGAVTFDAVSGTTYKIVVDGFESIFPSEPYGQGNISLEIAKTPPPPNDDFADAIELEGETLWNGIYAAGASGHTWNATKEPGEPAHMGDPGGASVWYSWTAPFTGLFAFSACGRFERSLLAVYTGDEVSALTPIAADNRSCSAVSFVALQGTTYRIAVDGKYEPTLGRALMGAISVNLYWVRPEPAAYEEGPLSPAGPLRPETMVRKKIVKPRQHKATFVFGSNVAGSRFRCKLDRGDFGGCRSPKTYRHLAAGKHVFKVAAVRSGGVLDLTPATVRFKIPRPHRAHD
ncbi:MAG TPA: hypothetical protein VGW80_02965 [Solirubrobacterales bacterium]|jgi:hypothetical protein|nr:hypothetical protein [Solirubrobacterales bacterium]